MLPVLAEDHTDPLPLLWMLDEEPWLSKPSALVQTRSTDSRAGMRTHLSWLPGAGLSGMAMHYFADHNVPLEDGCVCRVSHGVRAQCREETQ